MIADIHMNITHDRVTNKHMHEELRIGILRLLLTVISGSTEFPVGLDKIRWFENFNKFQNRTFEFPVTAELFESSVVFRKTSLKRVIVHILY